MDNQKKVISTEHPRQNDQPPSRLHTAHAIEAGFYNCKITLQNQAVLHSR